MLPTLVFFILTAAPQTTDVYWQQPSKGEPVKAGDCFVAVTTTLVERVPCPCETGKASR